MSELSEKIIAMEKASLDRWGKGDPSGFLEISAEDVVYFDPFTMRRIDGLDKLTEYYEALRGQVYVDNYTLINPLVQECGDCAVLTFNFESITGESESRWNCTEVYKQAGKYWKIIQTHWSFTRP